MLILLKVLYFFQFLLQIKYYVKLAHTKTNDQLNLQHRHSFNLVVVRVLFQYL